MSAADIKTTQEDAEPEGYTICFSRLIFFLSEVAPS